MIAHYLEKMEFTSYRKEKISGFVASFGFFAALKVGERVVDLPMISPARQSPNVAHFVGNIPFSI